MSLTKLLKFALNVNRIKIISVETDEVNQSIYINVEMTKGKKKRCPICGKKCPGYDSTTSKKKWRALDFNSCAVYIVADVHRISCKEHGVLTERVEWAYHHSNFTKEFEQQVSYLAMHLTKTDVCKIMRINWKTVGPIISRTKNRIEPDSKVRFNGVTRIGIDETSYKKGHKYITVVVDHDTNQVIWVAIGTGKDVLESFFMELTEEQRGNITLVSADGAKWIKSSIEEWLPNAERCIDGFHVVSWAIEALDELRKQAWRRAKKKDKQQPKRKKR